MNEREVFTAALEKTDFDTRSRYLDKSCGRDAAFRRRVEVLLRAHEAAGDLLDRSAMEQYAPDLLELSQATIALDSGLEGDDGGTPAQGRDTTDSSGADAKDGAIDLTAFLEPAAKPGSLGRLAGHYDVLSVLGHGGFGIVLKAFDDKLHRMVAIKILGAHLADNATARKRFLREARAAAAVSNEHVVNVYAVDEQPVPYLVMEYIHGQTLQDKLDRAGTFSLAEVLRIGQQIADGLAAAHGIGLIHRDIKPANILLENGIERVKISDFGLARAADDGTLTQSGVITGTPMYMAPEQAQDDVIDHRADLFSLGSVLYALCAGRPPFRAANTLAVLKRVCEDTPRPIREINPDVPQWLCDIIARLHEKKPEDRLASAREVADLLSRCLVELQQHGAVKSIPLVAPGRATSAPKAPSLSQRPRRWPIAAAILLLGVMGLGFTEATGVTNMSSTVIRLLSPDGTLIVEVDDPSIAVRIDGTDLVITGAGVKEIRLKPGEHRIQTSKDGKLLRQELISLSKNGRQIVRVSREGDVVTEAVVPMAGKAPPRAVAPLDAAQARVHQQAWAKHLGRSVVTTNTQGMKLVLIPPGRSVMGGAKDEDGWDAREAPRLEVEISKPFLMSAYEVTVGQFKAFVNAANYVTETEKLGGALQWDFAAKVHKRDPAMKWNNPGYEQTDEHPVVCVTWSDAQAYCKWLSTKEGVEYTLPTEAQWEYACRAGTTTMFYFGNQEAELEEHSWSVLNSEDRAHPTGQKRPNPWGLHDLYGNAWEWVADFYDAGYYAIRPKVDPKNTDGSYRVMRGGSRSDRGGLLRSAHRGFLDPDVSNNVVGFRVVTASAAVRGRDPKQPSSTEAAKWERSVAQLSADEQIKAVVARLKKLNPEFSGKVHETRIDGDQVVGLVIHDSGIVDLSPLRPLTGLRLLQVPGCRNLDDLRPLSDLRLENLSIAQSSVTDLSPLRGMALTGLELTSSKVSDLTPLTGMPLRDLQIAYTQVRDLTPLKGMKLEVLNCDRLNIDNLAPLEGMPLEKLIVRETRVVDLAPLKGMPLTFLYCNNTPVADLAPLTGAPLRNLDVHHTGITSLAPLIGAPLQELNCSHTKVADLAPLQNAPLITLYIDATSVTDLTPLQGMPLKLLNVRALKLQPIRDGAVLRSLMQLEAINGEPPAEFLKQWDGK